MNNDIEFYVSMFRDAGVACIPCSEAEIAVIERQLGADLPTAYKAFLAVGGNGFEPLEGSHYALEDDLADLQRTGRRIAGHEKAHLPEGAFVFLVHQGSACLFFLLHDTDDPVVFECVEGSGQPRPISKRFSDWVLEQGAKSRAFKERPNG